MKTKYLLLLLSVITVFSCQDPDEFLDVIPTGTTIPTTLEDFDLMLQDYAILRSVGTHTRYKDPDVFHSDVTYITIANDPISVNAYNWQYDIFNAEQSDVDYNNYYYYIHVMNQILQDIDQAESGNFNAANRPSLKAQALGQRAMEYFLAVNQYAPHYDPNNPDVPGIPMPLSIDLQAQLGRSTVGEVYNRIKTDLEQAISILPDNMPAINSYANFRPGKASLYALLAEVNLFMGDFDEAVINSDIALSLYDYLYDYNDIDLVNSTNVWSGYTAPASNDWYVGTLNREVLWHRYNFWGFANPHHLYAPKLEALYDKPNDRRWYLFSASSTSGGVDVSPYSLYAYPRSERCIGMSVPRLMLTNAEAKARTNDGPGAITVLNTLLSKRLTVFTPLTHSDDLTTLQTIKNERRKELAGTSINLFDQKRYHVYSDAVLLTYTRTNPQTGETFTLEPGSDGYVINIAESIRNINPNLN